MARKRGRGRSGSADLAVVRMPAVDRRLWHPGGREAWALNDGYRRDATRLVVHTPKVVARKSWHFERSRNDPGVNYLIGFAVPDFVSVCLRRKERREVLHAKRKTGKGSGFTIRRRNLLSDIVC